MGLFSGISKAFKKITKGIKKAFSGVVKGVKKLVGGVIKGVSRIANSKWGKVLLTGAALFTGAMAVSGAIQGWTSVGAGADFMTKFVGGAKGFVSALANPIGEAKRLMGGVEAVAQAGGGLSGAASKLAPQVGPPGFVPPGTPGVGTAVGPPSVLPSGGALQAGSAAQQLAGAGAGAGSQAIQQAGQTLVEAGAGAADKGNWLTKAAEFGKEFIMTGPGADIIKGLGEGYAKEKELEMQYEHESRYQRAWEDPNNALAQLTRQHGFGSINVPGGAPPVPVFNPGGPIGPGGPTTTRGAPMPGEPMPVGG